ncbi:efflux RND transporter periplasmic adaptor subunit [Kaistia dalseonensis]|uniref:Multidrug efflux system membrane fusion protein n=1 Tax=Kaistia dalseonensis TaxID=410840 RepID=A0ABU0H700_9HYPH|nr:efflux RND transporter periplasmic adaptor subunit [Kaistia dalseonensis]MCX5495488.1 efflux RND transporter periplasmic adaptor subunit [Kaistia dalseonensis]MDQ0438079.1 multidrug efflux system membrane fusion protein [Kaistia dalseonensis]
MRKAAVIAVGAAILVGGGLSLGYWQHKPSILFGQAVAAQGTPDVAAGSTGAASGGKGHRGGGASVSVATAVAGDLPVRRSTIGWIQSTASTTVTTQQQGVVTALLATNGQEVKAGDVLVQLDDRAAQATLDRDSAAMLRDQATVTSTKADLVRAQDLFNRKFDSQQQLDQATAAAASATAVVALDQANITADKVVVDELKIRAPHNGRLGAFPITVGSLVQPGNPIVTLTDIDNIEAVFTVSDADVDLLRQSLAIGPVTVQISSADPGVAPASGGDATAKATEPPAPTVVAGKVDFIDSTITSGSGTIAVRAAVANTDRVFWPGQAVKVAVDLGVNRNIVIVPTVAIQQGQGGSNVFVVKPDKTIDVRPVQVAGIVRDKAGVSAGLKAGDQVVTEGQLSLATGMTVNVREPKAAGVGAASPPAHGAPAVVGGAS